MPTTPAPRRWLNRPRSTRRIAWSFIRMTCGRTTVPSKRSGASIWMSTRARFLASLAPTAPARRPRSKSSPGIERTFAPGQVARLAGRLARAGRVNSLPHDLAHHRRILVEILARLVVDELGHVSGDIAVQLALGLAFELRLRDLHADHGRQAFAHIVAGQVLFDIFEQPGLLPGCVDGAGESAAEAA